MYRYHVTYSSEKQIVSVDDKSIIHTTIGQELGIQSPFNLQLWDSEFEDWVNVNDVSQIPDKCKLLVVLKDPPTAATSSSVGQPADSNRVDQPGTAVNSMDNSHVSEDGTNSGYRHWPLVYFMPSLPKQLREELEAAKSVVHLSSSTTHGFVRVLYEDIIQYTLYPTSHQYTEVCRAILRSFPALRDRVIHDGAGSSQPHRTWMSLLTTKFKYERQKLKNVAEVQAYRKKFASKRRAPADSSDDNGTTAKRCRRVNPEDIAGAEDDGTHTAHVQAMKVEMAKSVPNTTLIDDRMNRTLSARRHSAISKPLMELLEEYPALTLDNQINSEVVRMVGKDVRAKLAKFFTASRVDVLLKLISQGKQDQLQMNVAEAAGAANNYDAQTQRLGCALLLLPSIFKESYASWFALNKDTGVLTPSLEIKVESLDQLFNLDEVEIHTCLDRKHVTHPADFLTAVASIVCFYWVFDVAVPQKLTKTISFLAGHICHLMPFKAVPAMQKVLNHIYD